MSSDLEKDIPIQEEPDKEVAVDAQGDISHTSTNKSSLEQPAQNEAPKAPYNPWMDPSSFPDGGLRAWLTVGAASACMFVSWG